MHAQGTQAVVNSQILVSRITQPRSTSRWLVPLLGLYALAWVFHGQGGLIKPDETWFLQIVRRILSGEVLYRDVEYGATPLALYVTVPFVALFGAQLLVIRSVYMVFFAGSVLLARKISQQLARSPGAGAGVVLALCVYAQPRSLLPLYNPLAYLFLLGCLTAALRWQQDGSGKAASHMARHIASRGPQASRGNHRGHWPLRPRPIRFAGPIRRASPLAAGWPTRGF